MSNPPFLVEAVGKLEVEQFIAKAKRLVDDSGVKAPPVHPELLAKIQGIRRIITSHTLEASGQLIRDRGELVIKLNAKESVERRNFSCCHEIAHAFAFDCSPAKFHVATETVTCSRLSPEEYLCDRAAAEMLMPEKVFKPLAADLYPGIDSLVNLSKIYVSSVSATIMRLGQLAVWPVLFIVWKFTRHFDAPAKLRVFWSVRPAGHRCFIPRYASADPASGIYATFMSSYPTFENETLDLGSLRGKYLIENGRFGDYVVSIVHDPKLRRRVVHAG